jgi:Fibronectin type III domain
LMVAMLVAVTAGPALASPGNNSQGAAHADPNAAYGITTAVTNAAGGCQVFCE